LSGDKSVQIDFVKTALKLSWMVVIPVVAGHLTGRLITSWERITRKVGSAFANLVILWIIAVVVANNREELGKSNLQLLQVLLYINAGGYAAGYLGGWLMRLPEDMRRALTLEIGMQNAGLGATLATQLFPQQPAVAIAPAMYTFGCMMTGTLLARLWAAFGRPVGEQDLQVSSPSE
jgi:BASS family bile acid:Na+ symporter